MNQNSALVGNSGIMRPLCGRQLRIGRKFDAEATRGTELWSEPRTRLAKIMISPAVEMTGPRVRRDVVSFVRRSNRMRPNQRRAWEAYRDRFVLDLPRLDTSTSVHPAASLDLVQAFGRDAELVVEIGPGTGESLIPMAWARPLANVLAFEVYRPAIARMVAQLVRNGLDNVRIVEADARAAMEHLVPVGSVGEIWLFFPDPWHKARHRKRRLLTPEFAALSASRMKPGGTGRTATGGGGESMQSGGGRFCITIRA